MEKQKSVTIKETLFMDLVKYFLVNVREDEDRIRLELQKKLDVLVKRELYTKYKTAKSATGKEKQQDKNIWRRWECQKIFVGSSLVIITTSS